jgi:signal transduction histidine kinase/CheY-like chemotaxis protein
MNTNKFIPEKENNLILFLIAFIVPTFLTMLVEWFIPKTELNLFFFIIAGILLGFTILGLLLSVGNSGYIWKLYSVITFFTAIGMLGEALSIKPTDINSQISVFLDIVNSLSISSILLTFLPLIIRKIPLFKVKKNGKRKTISKTYLILIVIAVMFQLITIISYNKYNSFLINLSGFLAIIMLVAPLVFSYIFFRRDRTDWRINYGKKNSTIEILSNTVNGNIFLSYLSIWIAMIVYLIELIITESLGINFEHTYGATITKLYPCLFLLITFVNDMRRTKIALRSTIIAEHEARHMAEKSQEKKREAERANKEKSTFLANMSHEIRTPINGVLGLAQIELDKNPPEDIRRSLEMIYSSGRSLLDIINDILDFSKIESGKIDIINAPYDFGSMINDTMILNVTRIGSKPIEFTAEIDPNSPAELVGDYVHIKQILNNMLSNAFKYTSEGYVKLGVRMDGRNIVFTMTDTGQGLSAESVAKLGEAYARFNENANVSIEGTGLGMNITRNLIDRMNGTLEVVSELGKGSTFTVTLPQEFSDNREIIGEDVADKLCHFSYVSARSVADVSEVVPMPHGNVLVVDDNATNLFVAEGMLAVYRLGISTAISGFEAIDMVNEGNVYDIIFMDHMMPKMDGVETVRRLRDGGYTAPIVALTANALSGIDKMFLENGFDGFIPKPIDKKTLNDVLVKFIPQSTDFAAETVTDDNMTPERRKKLTELFLLDANSALKVLPESADTDMNLFAITAHAMKSALANMGNSHLSERAKELEFADHDVIKAKLPEFLTELQAYVQELRSVSAENNGVGTVSTENVGTGAVSADNVESDTVSTGKIRQLITACEDYDEMTANSIMSEIKSQNPGNEILSALSEISLKIMVSEFEEAAEIAENLVNE